MIDAVNDFTDGDETSHLPVEFAGTVLAIRPELFPSYYQFLVENEHWHDAETAFQVFIKNANFADPIVQAVARTIVDTGGLNELEKRADAGDPGARSAFDMQKQLLGGIKIKEETPLGDSTFESQEHAEPPIFEDYPPERLQDYIDMLRKGGLAYRSELMMEWFEHWSNKGQSEEVLESITALSRLERYGLMLEGLLDRIFELCLSLRGHSAAYHWLVKAHRARYGWSRFHTGEDEALRRFERVASFYPERWLEFIHDVAVPKYSDDRIGHIPGIGFDRLVKFLLIVGQREVAAKVAETAVRITLERKADLALPTPTWISEDLVENLNLRLLFMRLEWPSLMVREQAAAQIVELLKDPEHCEMVGEVIIAWLSIRKIETLTTNLLVIPLRLRAGGFKVHPDAERIGAEVRYPSLLSHLLLAELRDDWRKPYQWSEWHSGRAPNGFTPSSYFEHYKTAFLPPIYEDRAKSIENRFLMAFQRQWAYEWERVLERTGLSKSGPPYYFVRSGSDKTQVYIDVTQSEVYRSAYLRALAWAVDESGLPEDTARLYALECCPIDIGVWEIQLSRKPTWWPLVETPRDGLDTIPGQLWSQIEATWKNQQKEITLQLLVQAGGPIIVTETVIYNLEIYDAFQHFEGGDEPRLEEVAEWLACQYTLTNQSTATLSGQIYPEAVNKYVKRFVGWSLAPAAFRVRSWTSMRWKAPWMYRGVWIPAPYLIERENKLVPQSESLKLEVGQCTLAHWQIWHDHLQERWDADIPPGVGEFLWIDRECIRVFCEATRANFCWVVRVTVHYRQRSYDAFKSARDIRTFGASRILT